MCDVITLYFQGITPRAVQMIEIADTEVGFCFNIYKITVIYNKVLMIKIVNSYI